MNKYIFPLTLGGLGIGTTEFVIMGLLPEVAAAMGVSIPSAGYLISAYALGVVIGAPLLVAISTKYNPKKTLLALMVIFTLFNGLSGLAPNFNSLIVLRFLSGLPHGAFFGIGAVVASQLAKDGKQAQSIAMMFLGLTVANLAMVPLVTLVGQALSWRFAFLFVALIGAVTVFFIHKWLPDQEVDSTSSVKSELQFFKTGKAWLILLITAIGFGGLFAWFSYVAPLSIHISRFSPSFVPYIMLLAGIGMVIGNILGGILADKMRADKAAILLFLLQVITLLAVFFFSDNQYFSLILTFLCGLLAMAVSSPINMLMITTAKDSARMGAAFMQAAFNVANSLGAYFGGLPLAYGLGFNYPSLAGAIMALGGLVLSVVFILKYKTEESSPAAYMPAH
ncbi:MFS transporter AraJ [Flavihumibacter cheonanensis]|uniref:MFS transporter n=1 Tax=Flavihumibacter cheonanensis TaxID=1442385 RepID=UPI001EF8C7AE|nr:MFS transporter [Flavihumibacter cheonanensis]MCG7753334.1 MFS transporter [Flavihumibacter cheonanensis]